MPTLKASTRGLARIKQARKEKGWTVYDPRWLEAASQVLGVSWEEEGIFADGISEGTWKRFLAGKQAINTEAFKAYCQVLGLDWQDVVERSDPQDAAPRRQDWGDAMDVSLFYGRECQLQTLKQWIARDRCRCIVLLGMGGIGKTTLSIKAAREIQAEFDCIIWRSLRNAPPIEEMLADLIQFLSNQQETELPETLDGKISRLLQYLRSSRCLLMLDNAESILRSGDRAGNYREGYQGYGQLIRSIGETQHQSCLVLTSREKPKGIAAKEGETLPVRCLQLVGLPEVEGREIFQAKGSFAGEESEWQALIERYAGNPLALNIVASAIRDFFDGSVSDFLEVLKQGPFIFDDIRDLLGQQFNRLTDLEREIMYWLAIDREPVTFKELQADFFQKVSLNELLQSLVALQQRSLIEKSGDRFTQQPVVMEYASNEFIERIVEEINSMEIALLRSHAWVKATAKDYIREAQISLLVQPAIEQLLTALGSPKNIEYNLKQILAQLKSRSVPETGYVAGNVLNLARQLKLDVSSWDFSHLAIWQAYLQGMPLHDVNFSHCDFARSVFTETLGNILCVAFSPDGAILATCDTDCQIRLWEVTTGKLVRICRGHTNWVRSVAFSPNGKILASGGADRAVKFWNVSDGACLKTCTGHENEVFCVAFRPDGQLLASASGDNIVRLWDVRTGQCAKMFAGHRSWVRTVAFSPDGQILASGSDDQTARLWDVSTGECIHVCNEHTSGVRSVAFSPTSPEGYLLASGSSDATLKLWEVSSSKCIATYREHSSGVYAVAFSSDGKTLASGSGDHTVRLWDYHTHTCIRTLYGHTNQIFSLAFSPNAQTLVCVSLDQTVRLWDCCNGRCLKTWYGHTDWAFPVAFSADGSTLASGSNDATVRLWNYREEKCINILRGHRDRIFSVAFSPHGDILASGSIDQTVRLWDIGKGECFQILQDHQDWVRAVAFSPDGTIVASGSADKTVKLWDCRTGQCLQTLTGHTDQVYSVAFSPNGKTLVSGSTDKTARLWNCQTGECLREFVGHSNRVFAVAFSPDAQTLASGSTDNTVKLWDVESGQCLKTYAGHTNWVFSIAFSPNGYTLISGSHDGTVRRWDVQTAHCLQVYSEHEHLVSSVAFSLDGKSIASGSQDQTVRIWDVETGECVKILIAPRLYEGMKIVETKGLTQAQAMTLKALGAILDK